MEKITGRSDDMMIIRGVNVFPSQIEELLVKVSELAPHYQIILDKQDRLDTMTVLVEPALGMANKAAGAAEQLTQLIKGNIGITAAVSMQDEGGVERSLGKARRIIDNRASS